MHNPNSLVSRLFKARYFPDTHLLRSIIWTTKERLFKGFRWILGDGMSIKAVKDPWLRLKIDFNVEMSHIYEGRDELVSSHFLPGTKFWDVQRIREQFVVEDVNAILTTSVPQRNVNDKVVWMHSCNGLYTVKVGYRFWHNQNFGTEFRYS